ncbi:hypothetical protein RI054_03g16040 [Pseudoscourfieldia marina]
MNVSSPHPKPAAHVNNASGSSKQPAAAAAASGSSSMKRDRSTDSLEKLAISCSHHMSPPNRLRTGVIAAATPTSGGSAGEGTPDAHMSDSLGDTTEMMVFEHNNNNNNNNAGEEETTSPPIPGEPNININKHKPDPEYDPETEAPNHGRKVTPDSPCAAFGLSRRQILKGLACAGTAAVVEATLAPAAAKSKQPPPVIHEQQGDEEAAAAAAAALDATNNAAKTTSHIDDPLERLGLEETEVLSSEAVLRSAAPRAVRRVATVAAEEVAMFDAAAATGIARVARAVAAVVGEKKEGNTTTTTTSSPPPAVTTTNNNNAAVVKDTMARSALALAIRTGVVCGLSAITLTPASPASAANTVSRMMHRDGHGGDDSSKDAGSFVTALVLGTTAGLIGKGIADKLSDQHNSYDEDDSTMMEPASPCAKTPLQKTVSRRKALETSTGGTGGMLTRAFLYGAIQGAVVEHVLPALPGDKGVTRAAGILLGAAAAGVASGVVLREVDRAAEMTLRRTLAFEWKQRRSPGSEQQVQETKPSDLSENEDLTKSSQLKESWLDVITFASLEMIRAVTGEDPVCPW